MKRIKPGRIDENLIFEEEEEKSKTLTPSRISEEEFIEEVEEEEKKRLTSLKGMSEFAKKSATVLGLLAGVVLIGTLYDAFSSAASMMESVPMLGVIYLVMLFGLIGLLGYGIAKEMVGYLKIKRIDKIQEEAKEVMAHPFRRARAFVKKMLTLYREHEDKEVRESVQAFERELPALMDDEIMKRFDEVVLTSMDEKAKRIITKYANQTALSTAISPVAMIDAILILSRSHVMIKEIAKVYGLRPNFLGEMVLVKKVFINLAFAAASEIMLHHSHDIFGASVLSKVSSHGAQGVANGILTARVGLGTIKACRPIELTKKQDGFFKNIFKMITKSLFGAKK